MISWKFWLFITIAQISAWPSKTFAPYVDILSWPTLDVSQVAKSTGHKHFTLAFVVADSAGAPTWGGVIPMTQNFYATQLASLRALGGEVIVSFGGANGRELGVAISNAAALAAAYQSVIDRYSIKWVDFDIEGSAVADLKSVNIRNQALAILKKNNPNLILSYTLPTLPTGLTAEGINLLKSAAQNNVPVDVINIMAMDYGNGAAPNGATGMGGYAIQAANAVYTQAQQAGLKSARIGVTPMIGVNDVVTEVFRLEDARQLLDFALKTSWIAELSFWSVNRDTSVMGPLYSSSQITQNTLDFCNVFKGLESGSVPSPTVTSVSSKPVITSSAGIPTKSEIPVPTITGAPLVDYQWQNRVFAPYLNVWANTEATLTNASFTAGVVHFTIAFVVDDGKGNPAFDGTIPLSTNFLVQKIADLRLYGGDIIVSFGGASGKELALVNTDVAALQQKYQNVIDQYALSWVDFDIEGNALGDAAANNRRNQAIAGLQRNNPLLRIAFTLPCSVSGLETDALIMLKAARLAGVRVDVVNLMTMDYGTGVTQMGDAAINSANGARLQLTGMGMSSTQGILLNHLNRKVGITAMIGQNDIKTEIFTLSDAQKVVAFAKQNAWVGLLSFWMLQRDNSIKSSNLDTSSNYPQEHLAFSKVFVQYEN